MNECSLNHFTESLEPWLNSDYIRSIRLDSDDRIIFSFIDGVSDIYRITDCNRSQVEGVCRDLQEKGILVKGLE